MPGEPDAFETHLDASPFNVRRDNDSAPRTGTQHADKDATRKSANQGEVHHVTLPDVAELYLVRTGLPEHVQCDPYAASNATVNAIYNGELHKSCKSISCVRASVPNMGHARIGLVSVRVAVPMAAEVTAALSEFIVVRPVVSKNTVYGANFPSAGAIVQVFLLRPSQRASEGAVAWDQGLLPGWAFLAAALRAELGDIRNKVPMVAICVGQDPFPHQASEFVEEA